MRPEKLTIDPTEAVTWARDRYGLEVSATPLPGEIDRNFLLSRDRTPAWVLKIAPAGANRDEIERRIARLRDRAASVFPDRPDVFERTYGRRFQRLRTKFRPAPGLF